MAKIIEIQGTTNIDLVKYADRSIHINADQIVSISEYSYNDIHCRLIKMSDSSEIYTKLCIGDIIVHID